MRWSISRIGVGGIFAALLAAPVALAAGATQRTRPAPPAKPAAGTNAAAPKKPAAARPAAQPENSRAAKPAAAPANGREGEELFRKEVRAILEAKCIACHSGEKPQGGLRLTRREDLLKGGASGPAVLLARPRESLLVKAVHYEGRRMPPQGKLAPKQIAAITRWVELGAPWPADASLEPQGHQGPPEVNAETRRFWSFQPVKRPPVPAVRNRAWVRTPIDAFVLARLEKAGLAPNPPADRAALLRRAYYDLIGLPPTPEEVRAFLADRSPNAWEKVVDRLLASPHYGEKWGRHWLDLVRFAESNSYERDGTKPFAWRYRDYVIRSFNEDKPYDQFILEQLAGDELPERTPERIIATGYYRLGLWDDEPADPELALYDDLDDIASTTGQVFLGLTVGCARCHDHKLDPMPQKDYYRFLAFFNGVRRYGVRSPESVAEASLRPIAPAEEVRRQRAEIEAHRAKVRANAEAISAIEAKILPDLKPVEKEEWRTEERRIPIVQERVPRLLSQEEFERYVTLTKEREELRRFRPSALDMALCVTEVGAQPRETFVLLRGNPHVKGEKVEPGIFSVLGDTPLSIAPSPHGDTSGRRLALARWIASKENPLTARVMVNRVWQYHFGRGIVRSPSNFGFQGDRPTHPELLDWLASEFMANGWRLKPLHRLIMLSSVYRMSSRANARALAKDPENQLFWRFEMRRLQAEEVRDSILAVNGSLNLKMGGPSFYPDMPAEVLAGQSMPGTGWGKSSPEEQRRRSVYIFVKRSLQVPIIAAFDGPETDFSCPARFSTTQPTQALGMLNSAWMQEQARVFAAYLQQHAGSDPTEQVKLALWRTFQREPTPAEVQRGVEFMAALRREEGASASDALAMFCLIALNTNEFIYLD